jgi:hypothetical protein
MGGDSKKDVFRRNVGRDQWLRRNTADETIAGITIRSPNGRPEISPVGERNRQC